MKILIADDDFTSRTMLAGILKKRGYDVQETINGVEAWEILRKNEAPLLAIIDWTMPEMDGLEVVRRVRSLKTEQPPYIIMLTARGNKGDIIAGLDTGANEYLIKPFDSGELLARIGVGKRILELQAEVIETRNALLYEATHDPLTGILNRRAIFNELQKELARTERSRMTLCIGLFDIDHFKRVNDQYGHQTGDEVLRAFAGTLQSSLREYDLVGRYGGEEFLVITPDFTGTPDNGIYERLCAKIAGLPIAARNGEIFLTTSIGVACASARITVDAIIEAADNALYRAKESGRNRVCYASNALAT